VFLEEGERDVATHGIYLSKGCQQGFVGHLAPVNSDPLVVTHEVRRREKAGFIPGGRQDRVEVGSDRALAVGAANGQDRSGKRLS
jgi:hypothetical protein